MAANVTLLQSSMYALTHIKRTNTMRSDSKHGKTASKSLDATIICLIVTEIPTCDDHERFNYFSE